MKKIDYASEELSAEVSESIVKRKNKETLSSLPGRVFAGVFLHGF